jgi:hypothetical protein
MIRIAEGCSCSGEPPWYGGPHQPTWAAISAQHGHDSEPQQREDLLRARHIGCASAHIESRSDQEITLM